MSGVSVVIPVKNGIETIKKCIDGILSQTINVSEIVVVDSGSTDGTLQLLKQYGKVKLIEILPGDFNHGETRNLGFSHTVGDVIVYTVQDAWPVNEHWLEHLIAPLKDKDIVAVCGQQVVPHEADKNPVQWFRPYSTPQVRAYKYTREEFGLLNPEEMKQSCSWDNVTAVYKRDVLLEIPFRKTIFAEDALWAKDALSKGYTIAYNYAARVYHYHHEDAEFSFKRCYAEVVSTYKIFSLLPPKPEFKVRYYIGLLKSLYIANGISLADKIKWWKYNINLQKSYAKAAQFFYKMYAKGEDELDNSYYQICNKISASKGK